MSIEERKTKSGKTYTARLSYQDKDGKNKRKSKSGFKNKSAAKAWLAEQETLKNQGANMSDGSILFVNYFENWYKLYKKDITETSLYWYKHTHKILSEAMPDVTLEKLSRPLLQAFFNDLGERVVYDTAKKIRGYLKAVIKTAMYEDIIKKDPTYQLTITGLDSKDPELKYLEEHQLVDMLAYINSMAIQELNISDVMILVSAASGMRYQEVAVLTLNDLRDSAITINKAYDEMAKEEKTTKTPTSKRIIDVPRPLINTVRNWAQIKEIQPNKLLFTYTGIKPLSSQSVNRRLKRILAITESEKIITFHGLRHTHASLLISNDVGIQYVSERLGHASVTITLQTYAHLLQKARVVQTEKTLALITSVMQDGN